MNVYIDTSAILAVLNAQDRFHVSAKEAWYDLLTQDSQPLLNNYILIEIYALLQHRFGTEAVRLFQSEVLPVLQVSWVDESLQSRAISAMLVANRRDLSLVDCASFETMRQLGISRAFAFDPHFKEQGFEVIPALDILPFEP